MFDFQVDALQIHFYSLVSTFGALKFAAAEFLLALAHAIWYYTGRCSRANIYRVRRKKMFDF